jgi:hypothetical protein
VIAIVIRIIVAMVNGLASMARPRRPACLNDDEVPEWIRQQSRS